jgi:hypothetical protein
MAEVQNQRPAPDAKVADAKLPQTKAADPKGVGIAPRVVQSEFPETMKPGLPGMINRMVDYNAVTRSAEAIAIPFCRAVSQSTASDIGAIAGGALNQFVGITILDPTVVIPVEALVSLGVPEGIYPPYSNMGVLSKGEIFAVCTLATLAGDPLHYEATSGILLNAAGIGPVPGAKWKYTRAAGELNVVQLGIQT